MVFEWSVRVGVVYALAVEPLACYSRFAARCLKMQPTPPTTKTAKKRHRSDATHKPRPADGDRTDRTDDDAWPCSDTESDAEAMDSQRREVRAIIRKWFSRKHDLGAHPNNLDGFMNSEEANEVLTRSVRFAISTFLPEEGGAFDVRVDMFGGDRCEADEGASEHLMYIAFVPSDTFAGGDLDGRRGGHDLGRGGVNVPWGNKLTPIDILDHEARARADAALMLIADRLGLAPKGVPGFKLLSSASGD